MSNYQAIATVTATLSQILQQEAQEAVPGAIVKTVRPDALNDNQQDSQGVNIFLYQVAPNSAWRNMDLPTRSGNSTLLKRPQVALDLYYLLSFFGKEENLTPQLLLGKIVSALHSHPILERETIRKVIRGSHAKEYLASSDLADQIELIKFVPYALDLEELSKLWSVFFQTPYSLSVAYHAAVVLIEGNGLPHSPLPVHGRNIYLPQTSLPVIEWVGSASGKDMPIISGSELLIIGKRLKENVTKVRIGEILLSPGNVSGTEIRLTVPDELRAGVVGVQVIHKILMGTPPEEHTGTDSNAYPFLLSPRILKDDDGNYLIELSDLVAEEDKYSGSMNIELVPDVGVSQRVVLLLNERVSENPASYSFNALPRETDSQSIDIPFHGVKKGSYLVRVQVDGAESFLGVDTDSGSETFRQYISPSVIIGRWLKVDELVLEVKPQGNRFKADGKVHVLDQNGKNVKGANVKIRWTLPDGREDTIVTKNNGSASFKRTEKEDNFEIMIIDVSKEGYTFDREKSILE